jgi:HSP20 family protein
MDRLFAMGRLWDDWLRPSGDGERRIRPALDVAETEHAFTVTAELPGLAKEDVSITVENGVLTISGEKKFEEEKKDKAYHRIERAFGSFARSLTLPKEVEAEKAEATFKDGVLTIELPKVEHAKPRTVKVK